MATLTITNRKIKKPYKSKENIFVIYSPKSYYINAADTKLLDTEILINLPENSIAYLTTKFRGQKIKEIIGRTKERLWITLLNESYFEKYKIKKGDITGYLLFSPTNLYVNYEKTNEKTPNKKRKLPNNYLPKKWNKNWETCWKKKKNKQVAF